MRLAGDGGPWPYRELDLHFTFRWTTTWSDVGLGGGAVAAGASHWGQSSQKEFAAKAQGRKEIAE
jgi:hypothetical protein